MPKKCYYATFGIAHPLRDRVQRVIVRDGDTPSEGPARVTLLSFYGNKWAFIYGPYDVEDGDVVTLYGHKYRLIDHDLEAGEEYQ